MITDVLFIIGLPVLVYIMYRCMRESKLPHGVSREPDPIVQDYVESKHVQ